MTTTAHEDQFTTATQTVVVVREAYDTVAILRRNIADMEVALRTQTDRAEAAEAELAKLAQQKPVAWMDAEGDTYKEEPPENWCPPHVPLYASFAHAMHKGATHCDDCGLAWLDDGLNPLRCPYCKDHVPAPAVPAVPYGIDAEAYGIDAEASNRIALAFYDWVNRINQEPLLYAINRILATEAHPLSDEGQRALLQSARGAS